jgi:threonine dehydratase
LLLNNGITKFGAEVVKVAFEQWWQIIMTRQSSIEAVVNMKFLHPVCERDVIAGNATIARELLARDAQRVPVY